MLVPIQKFSVRIGLGPKLKRLGFLNICVERELSRL